MSGSVFLLIGNTGCGKTTMVKKIIKQTKNKKLFILSTDNDYGVDIYYKYEYKDWKNKCLSSYNSIFIFDEADTMLHPQRGRGDSDIIQIQIQTRKRNNLLIFIAHSWGNIGEWLIENVDSVFRWHTNDGNLDKYIDRYKNITILSNSLRSTPILKKHQVLFLNLK